MKKPNISKSKKGAIFNILWLLIENPGKLEYFRQSDIKEQLIQEFGISLDRKTIQDYLEILTEIKLPYEISHENIVSSLFDSGFERVDFVAEPGQFAIRGAIVDIFSYSYNDPFRISFFGDEIDSITVFDCNTQLSKEKINSAEIYPDIASDDEEGEISSICSIIPEDAVVWLDSSDMYKNKSFFPELERFRRIFMELPLSRQDEDAVRFRISPQPVFNKNFELLTEDIRKRLDEGYRVCIYGEKQSQLERLKSILSQNGETLHYGDDTLSLVAKGDKTGHLVFCIPVDKEIDLKAAASLTGNKKIEMVHVKDLLGLTGYIRGGCSPVGMKKKFPTVFDETAQLFDKIYVSAGQRGIQMIVEPVQLAEYVGAEFADITYL